MSSQARVLLVNPWIHDFAAYDYWMRPLGILYLASVLSEAGYQVDFVDCVDRFAPELAGIKAAGFPKSREDGRGSLLRTGVPKPEPLKDITRQFSRYGIPPGILREKLSRMARPDAILVTSMMTYWYTGVIETIAVVREACPGVPIILGGVYATLLKDHAARRSGADHVLAGEGENSIAATVAEVTGSGYSGRTYGSLDDYPLPMFSLLSNKDSLPVLTSRGCPFRCRYCASYRLMPGFRQRDPSLVADEIDRHHGEFGTRNFAFYDDALLVGKETHFKPMLRQVIGRGIRVSFHMPNAIHGKEVDPETAELMREAGCETVRIGLETTDIPRQRESGGKISSGDFVSALDSLEKAGYSRKDIETYVMMGLPGQPANEVEESIRFVNGEGATVRLVSYTPIPGTEYWAEAIRLRPSLQDEPLLQNNTIFPLQGYPIEAEEFLGLKDLVRELNQSL